MKVDKIISLIELTADPSYSASWDLSGVQVASKKKEIFKLAVCLDPTFEVLKKVLEWGGEFVLSHHPITLSPKLPKDIDFYYEILSLCFKNDLWLYSAHTSLDVQIKGPVSWLAKELDLEIIGPIDPVDEEKKLGFGIIGKLSEPVNREVFLERLEKAIGTDSWLEAGRCDEIIEVVGYCPGAGMSLASKAIDMGAQIFISGELKHHLALEIGKKGLLIDVGHFILEEKMMHFWANELKEKLKDDVEVKFFEEESPIRYRKKFLSN